MTKYLVDYFRLHGSAGALERVLARAGEDRCIETLADETSWTSYSRMRALLEAAAEELGGIEHLAPVAASCMESISAPEFTAALQDLGSPSVLYASLADAAATLVTIQHLTAEEVGPSEWLVGIRLHDGFEPFRAYCSFGSGLLGVPPMLFGLAPAEVVEEACQVDGAPACRFRLRWAVSEDPSIRADHLARRVEMAEARLEAIRSMTTDIVSGDDLGDVLTEVVAWTDRAVRGTGFLLVVDAAPLGGRWTHAIGVDAEEHGRIVEHLEAGTAACDSRLTIAAVTSERAHYGHLVMVNDTGRHLFPQEQVALETHARLAAAALDSASAVDEARRQAVTATALLQLSSSLSELGGVREMADRVACAVPQVVDCDRASVVLSDPESGITRFAGMWGYPPAVEADMRAREFPVWDPTRSDEIILWTLDGTLTPTQLELMESSGSVALAVVPINVNGVSSGAVIASVTEGPERLVADPSLEERMRGLAAQAGTAIGNAHLLDRIQHQALHDPLTGLPNRALILDRLTQMLARARRDAREVAALFIDLDDFKAVNDTLGHEAGDSLLRAAAGRIAGCLRSSDTVGRLGGDEFVVLAEGPSTDDGVDVLAERIHRALCEPFALEVPRPASATVTASIGIAVGHRVAAEELLRMADIALYRAKAMGRSCNAVFAPEMETEFLARVELEVQLRTALESDEFFLVYQPVYRLIDGCMTAAEALIRWRHPTRGVVGPAEFIPSLEETGLIDTVGSWVVRTACRQAAAWRAEGHELGVAINLSVRQLSNPALVEDVRDALMSSGTDPSNVMFEITESSLLADPEARQRLKELRDLGVKLAIDDFGTGYSSFAYLRGLPVRCLKVDRSFVSESDSAEGMTLLKVMLELGRSLGLVTVAEGIETEDQLCRLQLEGCEYGQGFHLARPMPAIEVSRLLDAQRAVR